MQIEQTRWAPGKGWMPAPPGRLGAKAQLVLLFGSPACLKQTSWQDELRNVYPATQTSYDAMGKTSTELSLLISCVGRKLVLKQRIEEEVEGVQDILGRETVLDGFSSYGEISPFNPSATCELHNQTMTITTLSEL